MTRFFLWLGEEKWLQFKSAVWENNLVVLQKGKHRICPNTLFFCCLVMSRRRQWRLTPVLLPGKSHGRRSLEGCSPCGRWGSDTTERLHFHFSLSCIGEGNGNPLQCSCLENPRDEGAWWAAVYGVTQSRTRLKWLSSSSSSRKWQPTPVFLPGESQGRGSLVGCSLWGHTESDMTEAT